MLMDEDVLGNHWSLERVSETIKSEDRFVQNVRIFMSKPNRSIEGKRTGKPVKLERLIHKMILLLGSKENDDT